jgi:hypothetical protein
MTFLAAPLTVTASGAGIHSAGVALTGNGHAVGIALGGEDVKVGIEVIHKVLLCSYGYTIAHGYDKTGLI